MMKPPPSVLLLLLVSAFTVPALAGTLTDEQTAKLHPLFRQMLSTRDEQGAALQKSGTELLDVIVYTSNPDVVRAAGIQVNSAIQNFVTIQASLGDIERLAAVDGVMYLDPGTINYPHNDVGVPEIGATMLHGGLVNGTPYTGQGAIVAVFDSGIDWEHLDFRDPTDPSKSRILWLWDQTITATGSEVKPTGFTYGVEYTNAQINDELDGSPANVVRERDVNGHGSHVTGTAAGNGGTFNGKYAGVAPKADIIVIKGGDYSFSETRMIDAMTYVHLKASALGKPVVINYSIGGHYGPHDGTRAYETAMNSFASTAGRVVVVSAGNDGNANMHVGGSLPGSATQTFSFLVPSYTPTSGTGNDEFFFDFWLDANTNVTATVTSPNGVVFTRNANETGDSPTTTDGTITLWNYVSSLNSFRNVQLWVHDATASTPAVGTWTLAIRNNTTESQPYDGWLASRTAGTATVGVLGGDNAKSVSMPGTSAGAVTVASWVSKWGWPSYIGSNRVYSGTDRTGNTSTFSSIGPTRDGRQKPDIAAPGQGITSVLSTSTDTVGWSSYIVPGQKHWIMQGTSMAAPHVTGAIGLLLGMAPSLNGAQVKSLLLATADADAFTGSTWNATWGAGKLDILEAVARQVQAGATITRKIFTYDVVSPNSTWRLTGAGKIAMRFSPDVSGRLTGIQLNATTINNRPIIGNGPLVCEVYTNAGGTPGMKLGNSVLHPLQLLNAGTTNYVQMLGSGVTVTSGTDFFVVLSQTNATDTLIMRTDNATGSTRSYAYDGATWGPTGANLRFRAIISSGNGVADVAASGSVPATYALDQNYPNPFNPSTTIRFSVPVAGHVSLKIYDVLGQEVATLVDDDVVPGMHTTQWRPEGLASGMYLYRLQSGTFSESRKLLLLK